MPSRSPSLAFLAAACLLTACGQTVVASDSGAGDSAVLPADAWEASLADAPEASATDGAILETGADAMPGPDAPREAGPEAGPDAGPETGTDATAEAEVRPDAAPDAGVDVLPVPEAGPDARPDATPDTGVSDAATTWCDAPALRPLALPSDRADIVLSGASRNASLTCTTDRGTGGPEAAFGLHLDRALGVEITVAGGSTLGGVVDTALAIRRVCSDPLSEVVCNNDRSSGVVDPRVRTVLDPGDYAVIVDQLGFGVGGPASVALTSFDPATNATCATSRALPVPGTLSNEDAAGALSVSPVCGGAAATDGLAVHYQFTVPAGSRAVITGSPRSAWNLTLRLFDTCTSTACTQRVDAAPAGSPETLTVVNRSAAARTYQLAVAPDSRTATGRFDLSATVEALPANGQCSGAVNVMDGTVLRALDPALAGDATSACSGTSSGFAYYHRATVPAGSVLLVSGTSASGSTIAPEIRLLDTCGAATCLSTQTGRAARWVNSGSTDRTVVIASQPGRSTLTATYDLSFAIRPAASNLTCATATPITAPMTLRGQDATDATETLAGVCATDATRSVFYAVTVPAGQVLRATATPTGTSTFTALRVMDGCSTRACLASRGAATASATAPATLRWSNSGSAPRTVILAVGLLLPAAGGSSTFDLSVDFTAPALNGTCSAATRVTDGTTLRAEAYSDAVDPAPNCTSTATSPALYYRAEIPAGRRLTVNVTPSSRTAPATVVRVLDGCGATACAALGSPNVATGVNTTQLSNAGSSPQNVWIAVSGGDAGSTFDLTVAIDRPPYLVSTIPVACEDMSSATVIADTTGDDRTGVGRALGMDFPYFGETVRAFAVATNGYLQLFPDVASAPVAAGNATFVPQRFPGSTLGRVLGVFFDDLNIDPSATIQHRVGTTAVIVQWTNPTFALGGGGVSRLTFQTKLFADGSFEYHYCSATTPTDARTLGQRASIGFQNASATQGIQTLFQTATLDFSQAWRFTPAP